MMMMGRVEEDSTDDNSCELNWHFVVERETSIWDYEMDVPFDLEGLHLPA